ncbi:zinc ABC transporter substrate-binding protein [Stappia sp. F7233]|uniref:Zinc ABC transporter substrate-binding protein n=1 Tax=Stappia albiluteola TaxID=2758565 RepID=A0A839AH99_9HYPH|nr:zinc ABC transporter substrate-binding protein [Stappia albiluteola]MBA5779230.1 zinc ABC transporter substrate-binding protein [Stappia albiluteola]
MPILRRTILLAILSLGVVALSAGRSAMAAEKLNIVTTVGMIADVAERIGGERVEIVNLIGEGVDPHSYWQTRSDVVKMGRADAILANGLYLEAQLEELLLKFKEKKPVYFVGEVIEVDERRASETYNDRYDPHVWMSPRLWRKVALGIRDALGELDPEGRAVFEENTNAYLAEMDALDAYARKVIASIPANQRILITAHDAFGYLGRDYDIEVLGVQGISTQSEAGLQRVEELVDLIVERDVKAVFVESSVSERNVRALVEGAAARGHQVEIGGLLYSDAMGKPGTYEGTYIGMLDHNTTRIARALGGDAPERGMQDKLGAGL